MVNGHQEKIARILRVDKKHIADLEAILQKITGRVGIIEKIAEENEKLVAQRLDSLGLARHATAQNVYDALISKVEADDVALFNFIGVGNMKNPEAPRMIVDFVKKLHPPAKGYFLKLDKAKQLLIAEPPKKILAALGYKYVEEMLQKEDLLEVYSALRFLEDSEWLNKVFFKQYEQLHPHDFEERQIEFRPLNPKWGKAAEKFVAKKYHNVSHLKELGIIFVIPVFLGISGETLRLVSLLFHYLNEVTYYSKLFGQLRSDEKNFAKNIISLLRGDVLENRLSEMPIEARRPRFLVMQRYLAKDDENDWRLFEPRINPEALHWQRAEDDIARINQIFPEFHNGLDFWKGLGWVGDYFKTETGIEVLVSFNLIDTAMALVKQRELLKYLYHHQEALWNKIFIDYFSVAELEQRSDENILKGWFEI